MKTDKEIDDMIERQTNTYRKILAPGHQRQREFHSSVFEREEVVSFTPPEPKIVIITKEGKRIEHTHLPENERNDDWDERIIAAHINRHLSGEQKQ